MPPLRCTSMRTLIFWMVAPFLRPSGCTSGSGGSGGGGNNPTVPGIPAGVVASAGNAQVNLTWVASTGAISYHVKRATASGGPYTQIAAPTPASYTDTGLTNGTTYYYVVTAVNTAGESGNSAEANAKPVAPVQVPSVPTGVAATPGNAQVGLTWTASSGATSYHVKRATVSAGPYTQVSAPSSASYTDTGLSNGTTYFYVITAVNSSGESANSAEVKAKPVAPAQIPSGPAGVVATAGNSQIALTWTASSGATSYHVKRATVNGGPYTQVSAPTSPSYTDTSLTNGTTYYYVVTAVNSAGESGNSSQVSAKPAAPVQIPSVPTGVVAMAGNSQIGLTWTASSGATSYHVKRATVNGGPYAQIATPTAAAYTDTGLTNGTPYYYVVTAVNSTGESANSPQATATPSAGTNPDVTITIDPSNKHAISPFIYGMNFYSGSPLGVTFDRAGGNRWTAYNWETNASNAGSDYLYENDSYLSSSTTPAEAVRSFIAGDQGYGIASLITVQMQGLVSGDENGPVSIANPPDLARFKQVVFKKTTQSAVPFTATPPPGDNYIYMDEFLYALDQKFSGQSIFGTNSSTHPVFVQFDNEPELWNSTHLEVQGSTAVTSDAYISKTISLGKALKDQFPNVLLFGPVHYGFEGIFNWQGELSATPSGNNWFPDKYLPALKTASATYGKPLVDVYDFHWYSEATDGSTRITNLTGSTLNAAQVQAIVQSPRSLWDATYKENSWIANDVLGGPIYILGRLHITHRLGKFGNENFHHRI